MLDYYSSDAGSSLKGVGSASFDMGLRAYMLSVYNHMAMGVAMTGVAAYLVYFMSVTSVGSPDAVYVWMNGVALTSFGYTMFASNFSWVIVLAPLAIVLMLVGFINRMEPSTARSVFYLYSVLVGASFGILLLEFTGKSVCSVFFISSATFGALSLYGYNTRRSLTSLGSFMTMGLFGMIIASIVNMFLGNSMVDFVLSVAGILIFSGLTAYHTQSLKNRYLHSREVQGAEDLERSAVMGALILYLDFVNLFLRILYLTGQRRG